MNEIKIVHFFKKCSTIILYNRMQQQGIIQEMQICCKYPYATSLMKLEATLKNQSTRSWTTRMTLRIPMSTIISKKFLWIMTCRTAWTQILVLETRNIYVTVLYGVTSILIRLLETKNSPRVLMISPVCLLTAHLQILVLLDILVS